MFFNGNTATTATGSMPNTGSTANKALTPVAVACLQLLAQGQHSKKQLWARCKGTAKVLGAATRNGYGVQGGGLLGAGYITAVRIGNTVSYTITVAGLAALAAHKAQTTQAPTTVRGNTTASGIILG